MFNLSLEMTEELLTWKPFLAQMPDDTGSTPLHIAASYGYDKIVRVLLEYDDSLAYLCDYSGSYPLHVAAKMGHVNVIKVIMDHCPDSDELLDAKRRNFLHVAAQERRIGVVRLVTRTTSKLIRLKNARDVDGNTPLHLAIDSGDERMISLLMKDKEVSLNIFNKKGLTPRDQAAIASFGDKEILPIDNKVSYNSTFNLLLLFNIPSEFLVKILSGNFNSPKL
jgi:ankyrin repeat protein